MEKDNYEHIQKLIDLFFEGKTSNAEEKELYLFFTQQSVLPKQFEPYRELFSFFGSGIADADEADTSEASEKKHKIVSFRKMAWTALSVAAAILLVFVIGTQIQKKDNDNFNPYEGSYMVKNGVRYDLSEDEARLIEQKAIKNEKMAHNMEKEALEQIKKAQEESLSK